MYIYLYIYIYIYIYKFALIAVLLLVLKSTVHIFTFIVTVISSTIMFTNVVEELVSY